MDVLCVTLDAWWSVSLQHDAVNKQNRNAFVKYIYIYNFYNMNPRLVLSTHTVSCEERGNLFLR